MAISDDFREYKGYRVYANGNIASSKNPSKLLKPVPNNCGYGRVTICSEGTKRLIFVHRIIAELFLSKPSGADQINHKDKNKTNNSVNNLEWVTCSENHLHSFKNGRAGSNANKNGGISGIKNHQSKLNDKLVLEIYDMTQHKVPQRQIAAHYNINQALVQRIAHKRVWRHLWL
jgi:hypothetical protein